MLQTIHLVDWNGGDDLGENPRNSLAGRTGRWGLQIPNRNGSEEPGTTAQPSNRPMLESQYSSVFSATAVTGVRRFGVAGPHFACLGITSSTPGVLSFGPNALRGSNSLFAGFWYDHLISMSEPNLDLGRPNRPCLQNRRHLLTLPA
jgi:hypothetical protein